MFIVSISCLFSLCVYYVDYELYHGRCVAYSIIDNRLADGYFCLAASLFMFYSCLLTLVK